MNTIGLLLVWCHVIVLVWLCEVRPAHRGGISIAAGGCTHTALNMTSDVLPLDSRVQRDAWEQARELEWRMLDDAMTLHPMTTDVHDLR